ncbi:MAG: PIN domain-containing protein, partial [Nitrospirae bacterium]|nr:PIN domain-containing protein [Nitrospirota bacterium]
MSAYHLLDTNVIIRLFDKKDIAHEPCMKTIENLFSFGNEPCLTTQVLIEFWAVTTRNPENNGFGWSKLEVSRHIEGLLEQFTFLPENSDVFPVWKSLVLANDIKGKRVHDASIVAHK